MSDLQAFFAKVLIVLLASPLWYPFLKAVWEELNESMAEEGGIFGRPPTAKEWEQGAQERELREDPLVHDAWPTEAERRAGRHPMGGSREGSAGPGQPPSTPRRRGFR